MGEHSHPFTTQTLSVNLLYTGRVWIPLSFSLLRMASSAWRPSFIAASLLVLGTLPSGRGRPQHYVILVGWEAGQDFATDCETTLQFVFVLAVVIKIK